MSRKIHRVNEKANANVKLLESAVDIMIQSSMKCNKTPMKMRSEKNVSKTRKGFMLMQQDEDDLQQHKILGKNSLSVNSSFKMDIDVRRKSLKLAPLNIGISQEFCFF